MIIKAAHGWHAIDGRRAFTEKRVPDILLGTVVGFLSIAQSSVIFLPALDGKSGFLLREFAAETSSVGQGRPIERALRWPRFTICSAPFRTMMPMSCGPHSVAQLSARIPIISKDPDAGLKFRRIMRANEIVSDVKQ